MSVLQLLDTLLESPGRNDKISILSAHKENTLVKDLMYCALNPMMQFYIKKIPEYDAATNETVYTLQDFVNMLPKFANREVTGNEAIALLSSILSGLSEDDAIVAARVISRDLRCGVAAGTVNKVWPKLIPSYPCLLASGFSEKGLTNIKFPAYSQLKLDGMRANIFYKLAADGTPFIEIRGRSGKEINLLGHLDNAIIKLAQANNPNNNQLVFDCELTMLDNGKVMSRKRGNGILNKAIKGTITDADAQHAHACIWDVIPLEDFEKLHCDIPYKDRFETLTTKAKLLQEDQVVDALSFGLKWHIVDNRVVNTIEEAQEHYAEALAAGEEGIMLKDMFHLWEDKRSKHIIKFKAELECDLKVVGWVEGTGKYSGKLGALVCNSEDGEVIVSVGSGFSDKDRDEITKDIIGSVITVKYNETIVDSKTGVKSLFLPRFIEHRLDKTIADSVAAIK